MAKEFRLARIKAYNPKAGYKLRSFTYQGVKFQVEKGWHKVDLEMAKYLETVTSEPENPHSPLGFDVCTEAEAKRLDEIELKTKGRTGVVSAAEAAGTSERGDLGTDDLARGTSREKPKATPARGGRATRAARPDEV